MNVKGHVHTMNEGNAGDSCSERFPFGSMDTIQIMQSVFADMAALVAATQDDPQGNAIATDAAQDTITVQHVTGTIAGAPGRLSLHINDEGGPRILLTH
jgi:serralysin